MKLADLKPRLVIGKKYSTSEDNSASIKWKKAHADYENGTRFRIGRAKVASWRQCPALRNIKMLLYCIKHGLEDDIK